MTIISFSDLPMFRRILGFDDLGVWNDIVHQYFSEYFPDARLTFSRRDQCWKVTNSEIDYFVDTLVMLGSSNVALRWSKNELSSKIAKAVGTLETINEHRSESRRRVSFEDENHLFGK